MCADFAVCDIAQSKDGYIPGKVLKADIIRVLYTAPETLNDNSFVHIYQNVR